MIEMPGGKEATVMRRVCWIMFVMLALLCPLLSLAEDATFHLRDGTVIEGQVIRKTGSAITIKHSTGVATYGFDEFTAETRDRYFSQLQQLAAKERKESRHRVVNSKTRRWQELSSYQKVQRGCAMAGAGAVLIAELWFITAAFSVSPVWGVLVFVFGGLRSAVAGILFVLFFVLLASGPLSPLPHALIWFVGAAVMMTTGVGLLFILRHWRKAIGPLSVELIGIGLFVIAAALEAIWNNA
jgi:hypothetical protein